MNLHDFSHRSEKVGILLTGFMIITLKTTTRNHILHIPTASYSKDYRFS